MSTFGNYLEESTTKEEFYRRKLPDLRKKLQACRDKMEKAQAEKDWSKMVGLGLAAIDIAGQYQIMLDNLLRNQ